MSISTNDLREALQAYADDVPLPEPASLIAGAERKRNHARKVRAAVIAGGAAVLMAVVTVIGLQGIGHEKALTPAQLNKKFHTHYAEYTRGLKLTSIVEVPVQHADDPNNASPAAKTVRVQLPKVGSTVYVACDTKGIKGKSAPGSDGYQTTQVRGSRNLFAPCTAGPKPMLFGDKPGEHDNVWIVTDTTPAVSKAPVAIYTQVSWDDYPMKARTLDPKPQSLIPTQDGEHDVHFSGTGDTPTSKTVQVPASMGRGASFMVAPSSTGRFQVLVDGKVQRLDYTGLPASMGGAYGWVPPGREPEVRGTWLDYWPDSGSVASGDATFAGPEPGSSATITIRAVGATGPWKAMLGWNKK
ncbi:hypothetical protein [Flexivirga alba]|uniref:DUF4179 domain-containing protein n=1 Tax=Flexivirga alba TaxID=702742 RepID=A0ABW2AGN0_9MICO